MMATETNSIFNFATKELSQDAFFAWLLNGWNTPADQPHAQALKTTAYDFLKLLYGDNIPFSQDKIATLTVRTQQDKIDVLVDVQTTDQQRYYLILEDKTRTSEHDKQISRYVAVLNSAQKKTQPKNPQLVPVDREHIHVAYVKVDYWNQSDQAVIKLPNTSGLNAEALKKFLVPRQDEHFLIKDFLENLIKKYTSVQESALETVNNCKFEKQTAFDNAVEEFFLLEKIWTMDGKPENGIISQGTSGGRPWANYGIWKHDVMINGIAYERSLFWRADSDKTGRYLCLRQFEWISQDGTPDTKQERTIKNDAFQHLQEAVVNVPGELAERARESINKGSAKGTNNESTLVHITLSNWSNLNELHTAMTSLGDAAKAAANKYWDSEDSNTTIGG